MAINTYVELDKVTVAIATNEVTFSSIAGTYTDLRIVINGTAASNSYCTLRFNGDTGSSYSNTEIVGDGATAGTYRNGSGPYAYSGSIFTAQTNNFIDILGYSNSTTFKSFLHRADYAGNSIKQSVGLWRNTAPITSVTVGTGGSTNFNVGTTFSLYGIKAWSNTEESPKAIGGYLYGDSTYWYHAFPFSSTFTPSVSLTADVLVLSGGGSAGYSSYGAGGGGGAGGISYNASQSFASATTYTMTVGAGGSASTGNGSQGNTSSCIGGALSFSVVGGGGGGGGSASPSGTAGGNGANGGGSQGNNTTGGTGSVGFNGGSASSDSNRFASGGGGGMGGVGGNATGGGSPATAGSGGRGVNTYSSWSLITGYGQNVDGTYYIAGGGAGAGDINGSGGIGGGGSNGNSGLSGLGGGGGAKSGAVIGGSGGSGIVIVRYAK